MVDERLPDLPPTEHEYWKESVVELKKMVPRDKCDHLFTQVKSNEVKCGKCGAGYFIGYGDSLKEGHLFHDGVFVV